MFHLYFTDRKNTYFFPLRQVLPKSVQKNSTHTDLSGTLHADTRDNRKIL